MKAKLYTLEWKAEVSVSTKGKPCITYTVWRTEYDPEGVQKSSTSLVCNTQDYKMALLAFTNRLDN